MGSVAPCEEAEDRHGLCGDSGGLRVLGDVGAAGAAPASSISGVVSIVCVCVCVKYTDLFSPATRCTQCTQHLVYQIRRMNGAARDCRERNGAVTTPAL